MFIPVSLGSGLTTVECIADVTGTLTAGCEVIYKTASYQANAPIQVVKNDTFQLRTTITGPAAITVSLGDRTSYWHVDLPKNLRYVEDLAFQRIIGTTYGKLYAFPSNTQRNYVETGTLTKNEDILASIDYVKKEIWLFGSGGGVKKITTPEKPVAVVFMPRWSITEGVVTTPYVMTEAKAYPLNADMSLNVAAGEFANGGGPITSACADAVGILVTSTMAVSRYVPAGGVTQILPIGASSVQTTYDNKIIVGRDDGRISRLTVSGNTYTEEVLFTERTLSDGSTIGVNSRYLLDVNHAEYVFAIDMVNRKVISIKLSDKTVSQRNLDRVPSSIVSEKDSVYVSFFNHTKTFKYGVTLGTMEEMDSVKTHGSSFLTEFMATDLYSNAIDVTLPEDATPIRVNQYDVKVDEANLTVTWPVAWQRPQYLKLASTGVTVTRNGVLFTEGYVASPDQLVITMPNHGEYYRDAQVNLIGHRPLSIHFRTEPKLFPDSVTLDTVYEAFIRYQYEDIFQIEGMTDGFSVTVGTDSGDMEFSVNDGPYAKTGTIKNGDVVEVRATIKNMITARNQHDIMTEFGMPVSLWTILVMQLNGVILRPDSTQEKDKFDVVRLKDTNTEEFAAEPQIGIALQTMASTDAYAPNLWSSDCNHELTVTCDLSGSIRTAEGGYEQKLNSSAHTYQIDYTHQLFQPYSHDALLQLNALEPVFGTHPTQITLERFHQMRPFGNVHHQPVDYDIRVASKGWEQDSVIVRYVNDVAFDVAAQFNRYVGLTVVEQAAQTLRYVGVSTVDQTAEIVRRVMSIAAEFQATVDRFYSNRPSEVSSDAVRSSNARMEEGSYDHLLRRPQAEISLSMNADLRMFRTSSEYQMDAAFGVVRVATEQEVEAVMRPSMTTADATNVVVLRRSSSIDVAMPENKWVTSNENEYFVAGVDSGFFDTQAEAEAYAATLNLKENTPAQFIQYEGKWILISTPVADNAACFPTEAPAGLQRRFGYAGGG